MVKMVSLGFRMTRSVRAAGAIALALCLPIAACRGSRSSKIRSITCCAMYQHSDTLPLQPAAGVIRIAIGGDSRDDRRHVVPWAFKEAVRRGAKAFVFLGDLELTRAEDRLFLPLLRDLGEVAFYPIAGNHEVRAFGAIDLPSTRRADRVFKERFLAKPGIELASVPEVTYTADIGNRIHIVALDNVSQRGFSEQLSWLEGDLRAASQSKRVILVAMHKPLAKNPITTHSMDEDGPRAVQDSDVALGLFKRYGVAMVLVSHSHMYASYQQDGIETRLTGGLGAPIVKGLAEADGGFHHFLILDVPVDGQPALRMEVVKFPGPPVRDPNDEGSEAEEADSGTR